MKVLGVVLALTLGGCQHSTFPGYPDSFRQFAYVANLAGNTVTVLDLKYLRADRTLRVGDHPVAIATSTSRQEAYVLSRQAGTSAGSLTVIDTSRNQVVATIPTHREPSALAVDASGTAAYVANTGSNTVSMIDLKARQVMSTVRLERPMGAAVSPDGRSLIVTSASTGIVTVFARTAAELAIKTSAGATLAAKRVEPLSLRSTFPGCPGATSPVILPDSSKAFVACPGSNQVMVVSLAVDPNSWLAKQDDGLLTDHAVALLDVGHRPIYLAMKPDGGEIFVTNSGSGSISEIDAFNNQVGNTFPIGDQPTHAIVSADGAALWVANTGADTLSLYSIEDGKLLSSLHTGSSPGALAFSADKEQRLLLVADEKSGDISLIRTASKLGPALFTILPAGDTPTALAVQASGASD